MRKNKTIDFYIKSTWHSLSRMYNQIASKIGGTQTIGYVLLNIEKEGTPATKIAPLLGMEPTSLSRLLKSMESNGLIYRQVDKKDRRISRIFLTEQGIKKRKFSKKIVQEFNNEVYKKINREELETFINVISKINEISINFKPKEI